MIEIGPDYYGIMVTQEQYDAIINGVWTETKDKFWAVWENRAFDINGEKVICGYKKG